MCIPVFSYDVFRDGKRVGRITAIDGEVMMQGLCGDHVPDVRLLHVVVAALAAEGCVLKVRKIIDSRAATRH